MVIFGQALLSSTLLAAPEPNWYSKGLQAEYAGDYHTAIENYVKSANSGLSDASFALGRVYKTLGDDETSFNWFLISALDGNRFAQYDLGLIYLNGTSAVEADREEALNWFTQSATAGHGEAAYQAFRLSREHKWLDFAVKQGVKEAVADLIGAYQTGLYGLDIDLQKSEYWQQQLERLQE